MFSPARSNRASGPLLSPDIDFVLARTIEETVCSDDWRNHLFSLSSPGKDWRRRHGRRLQGGGRAAGAIRRIEISSRRMGEGSASTGTVPAGGRSSSVLNHP